ncbi:MAG: hypothetical protein IJ715_01210 [Bacilli bacterium]|nr:hypothetical protein [Bacilli bacterium]
MLNVLVNCGGIDIPSVIPNMVHYLVLGIQIFIPIVLIVLGMLDMGKAVMSNDEKVMKENQGKLVKRIIYAVLVFLVVALVKTVIGMVAGIDSEDKVADKATISTCINYFVNGVDQ